MQAKVSGALAAGVLVAGIGGAVIAHAAGQPSKIGKGERGLALQGATIDHAAAAGTKDTVQVANNSSQELTVTVAARPWVQSSSGRVVPNRRKTLGGVAVSEGSFTLAPGKTKELTVTLNGVPSAGYLYGALEVTGMPESKGKGVLTAYRLIGALRYTAATPKYALKTGATKVVKSGKAKELTLSVRNTGNTVTPISGTVRLKGPLGTRRGTIANTKVLPGKRIKLGLLSAKSLPSGKYTATIALKQGTLKTTLTKKISVRR